MSIEIENFYEKCETDKVDRSYPNESKVNITLPFQAILVGKTGAGKTNLLMNLIKAINAFDKYVLIAKNIEEPLYKHFIKVCRDTEEKTHTRILLVSNTLADLPEVDDFDVKQNSLVIIDDFINASETELKAVVDLWIRGRKNGCSTVFLSQRFFKTPKMIRENSGLIGMMKIANTRDLTRILSEYELGDVDNTQIKKMYESAVAAPDHQQLKHFFMIDVDNTDDNLRFRKNFEGIKLPKH
jgi:hypothetical protein